MGVYIKGMEMPLNCATCYRDGTHYHVHMLVGCPYLRESIHSHDFRKERHPNCPLVELPPHGRLGDLDELKTAFLCGESIRTESVRATIDHMPTIIPADKDINALGKEVRET